MSGPVETVAAAASVAEAVDAVANAPETVSKLFHSVGRLVYGTGYLGAFAVVFPVALVFEAIPKANVLMQGIVDGAADAGERAARMLGR